MAVGKRHEIPNIASRMKKKGQGSMIALQKHTINVNH